MTEIANRTITIISNSTGEKFEMEFSSVSVKDSKALHHLLSFVDPGDDYTVVFKNLEN